MSDNDLRVLSFGDKPHNHPVDTVKNYIVVNHECNTCVEDVIEECKTHKACYEHEGETHYVVCFGSPGSEPRAYTQEQLKDAIEHPRLGP